MKRKLSIALVAALVITLFCGVGVEQAVAKTKKVKLSTKNITLYKGKTKAIKVKNAGKKVKWKIKNKKIAKIVKKSGKMKNNAKIKGVKKGSTKIIAICGNKKLTAKVVVKEKKDSKNTSITEAETTTDTDIETTTNADIAEFETNTESKTGIIGTVTSTDITCYSNVSIEYVLEGNSDEVYTYGMIPGKLEILENGVWRELEKKPRAVIALAGIVSKNSMGRLDIPLYDSYEGVVVGHYRYTHMFSGVGVSVEFDVIKGEQQTTVVEDKITGTVKNTGITVDSTLNIQYTFEGDSDKEYIYSLEPGIMEVYENGIWTSLTRKAIAIPDIAGIVSRNSNGSLSIPLKSYYEDIRVGHYRYTHTFSGVEVTVEFDVVE